MTAIERPTIDSRTYRELLAEATDRISVHNPEWLNYNDSDPGMTLLQLWAFMSENLLYQASLIPDRVRLTFFELLGVDVPPASAATGVVAFDMAKGRLEMTTIPVDREVSAGQVPFRTITGLTAAPVVTRAFTKRRIEPNADVEEQYKLLYGSLLDGVGHLDYYETEPVTWSGAGAPFDAASSVDGSIWLALLARRPTEVVATREVLGGQVLSLGIVPDLTHDRKVLPPAGSSATTSTDALEFHLPDTSVPLPPTPSGRVPTYRPVEFRTDTNVLVEAGIVELVLPPGDQLTTWTDLDPLEAGLGRFPPALSGTDAERLVTWIRVRPTAGVSVDAGDDDDAGRRPWRLSWVGANAAIVEQRRHVGREQVGVGTGRPDQRFTLANTPVLLDSVRITVDGVEWTLVDDLMEAGPEVPVTALPAGSAPSLADPDLPTEVVVVRRATGEVLFGDGLHGARPPNGAPIVATYDAGGGADGLVGSGAITKAALCAADAIAYVTGVKLGRRSLKFMDYGIMAATFMNLETGMALRVISTEEARQLACAYAPEIADKHPQQLEAYKRMPDSVLFRVQQVDISVSEYDLPGPTRRKVTCCRCAQVVRDHREVTQDGRVFCAPCAGGAYFSNSREINWPDMNWTPDKP